MSDIYAPDTIERCCSDTVRKITETQQYVMNGHPSGQPLLRVVWECDGCGRKLRHLEVGSTVRTMHEVIVP